MKILIVNPTVYSIYHLRGELLKAITDLGHTVVAVGPEPEQEVDLSSYKARYRRVSFSRTSKNPFADFFVIHNLKQVIAEEAPDLVFSYALKPVAYGSIAARMAKVPQIYSMISGLGKVYGGSSVKSRLLRTVTDTLLKKGFSACRQVIFQNQDDLKELVERGLLPQDKCRLVSGSGVSLEKFSPAPLPKSPVFLIISRLLREKGIMEFCEAARRTHKQYPQARFQIGGFFDEHPGELTMSDLRPYLDSGDVEYLGKLENVVPYLDGCTTYVLPSYYREGIPHSILEAMAVGRPIVTTDCPGCRETVRNGANGILVRPKNVEDLTNAFGRLCADAELREQMGRESLRYCRERFDVSIVNKDMLSILGLKQEGSL